MSRYEAGCWLVDEGAGKRSELSVFLLQSIEGAGREEEEEARKRRKEGRLVSVPQQ